MMFKSFPSGIQHPTSFVSWVQRIYDTKIWGLNFPEVWKSMCPVSVYRTKVAGGWPATNRQSWAFWRVSSWQSSSKQGQKPSRLILIGDSDVSSWLTTCLCRFRTWKIEIQDISIHEVVWHHAWNDVQQCKAGAQRHTSSSISSAVPKSGTNLPKSKAIRVCWKIGYDGTTQAGNSHGNGRIRTFFCSLSDVLGQTGAMARAICACEPKCWERRGLCDNPWALLHHRMWQQLAACLTPRQGIFDYPDPGSRGFLCRNFRRYPKVTWQASKWIEEKMLERCLNWCSDHWMSRQELHGPWALILLVHPVASTLRRARQRFGQKWRQWNVPFATALQMIA